LAKGQRLQQGTRLLDRRNVHEEDRAFPILARPPLDSLKRGPTIGKIALPADIQLLPCGYVACCSVRQCQARASTVARYTDDQGRPLKQRELCDRHAEWLKANRPNVHDLVDRD
jgi:hypothetical protein